MAKLKLKHYRESVCYELNFKQFIIVQLESESYEFWKSFGIFDKISNDIHQKHNFFNWCHACFSEEVFEFALFFSKPQLQFYKMPGEMFSMMV